MKFIFFIISTLFFIDAVFAQPAITVQIHRPKIRIGQTTSVLVTAHGLRDLAGAENPVYSLRITLDQPGVAAFGNASPSFTAPLDWPKVSPQGTFVTELSVTGLRTGAYSITADLVPGEEEMFAAPVAVAQDEECCEIEVSWHTHGGSSLDKNSGRFNSELKKDVLNRLKQVEDAFKEHKICITFVEGAPILKDKKERSLTLFSGGQKNKDWPTPNLCHFAQDANFATPTKPEIIIVDHINVWDGRAWITNDRVKGLTPYIGANVAAVKFDIHSLATYIQNELYHVFGLSDEEMRAGLTKPKHIVTQEMWEFMKAVCEAGNGKDALIEKRLKEKNMDSGKKDCDKN